MAEVFGTAYLEIARDLLTDRITELMGEMAVGFDPTFNYVYEKHQVAKLQLNAVSIDLMDAETLAGTAGSGPASHDLKARFVMRFSIRVHTAYAGSAFDGQTTAMLMNSVNNKLRKRITLDADPAYRIEDVEAMDNLQEFTESATQGGEIIVTIIYTENYTQE